MAKILEISQIVTICEQKKQVGDHFTLSKIFNTSKDAVRMRLNRKDETTYRALYHIIVQRDVMIDDYQKSLFN